MSAAGKFKFVGYSTEIIQQSKIKGPLIRKFRYKLVLNIALKLLLRSVELFISNYCHEVKKIIVAFAFWPQFAA